MVFLTIFDLMATIRSSLAILGNIEFLCHLKFSVKIADKRGANQFAYFFQKAINARFDTQYITILRVIYNWKQKIS